MCMEIPSGIFSVEDAEKRGGAMTSSRPTTAEPLIYIEPSENQVRYSGYLEAHVLDVIHREKDIAVLDISASCHATDLVLFDMKPDVLSPTQTAGGKTTILGWTYDDYLREFHRA